jgi:hypothetical protein
MNARGLKVLSVYWVRGGKVQTQTAPHSFLGDSIINDTHR